ncbi:MAG: hypothetical protein LUE15_05860 [Oscillospiraceae bacterium]|nr:hypothetical protein [Oscillospiraceae bacterium]
MALMLLAAAARCVYYARNPAPVSDLALYCAVPVASMALFAALLLAFGRRTLLPTCVGVFGGVFFFAVKAFTFASPVHTALCCLLYAAVLVLYTLTVVGIVPVKLPLYLIFGLPFVYHIFVEDLPVWRAAGSNTLTAWLPELSVLMIMAALFLLTCAMRRAAQK